MLIEFSVTNFKSFKNKTTFTMEKGIGNEYLNNTFNIQKISLLKTAAIYGSNGSGKSNMIDALKVAISLIRKSNVSQVGDRIFNIVPFAFSDETKNKPSEFEFIFISNNVKYKYGFSAGNKKIYTEYLYAYYSQKPTMIFERIDTNKYEFLLEDKRELSSIVTKNTDNKLFLATATNWNYSKTKDAYLWFNDSIDIYNNLGTISNIFFSSYDKNNIEFKKFTVKLLKEADIYINDFNIEPNIYNLENTSVEVYNNMRDFYNSIYYEYPENDLLKKYNIKINHEVLDNNGNKKIYELNINDESSGTKILFSLAPLLKNAFETKKVIIIDELEKSLHPTLVEFIIKLFNNPNINKSNSQLIFTTHDVHLLDNDLDLFRRDQIWFVEKEDKTCISNLYSLDEFSVRKGENIRKGYLNGRFGAIPFIKDNIIL